MRSLPFLVLMIFGVLNLIGNLVSNVGGARSYPVTHRMLSYIAGGYDLFILIVIVLYSAEDKLVQWLREDAKMTRSFVLSGTVDLLFLNEPITLSFADERSIR